MKRNIVTRVALGLILGVLLLGCETAPRKLTQEENIQKLRQELKDARTHYRAQWHTFKSETEEEIARNTMKIDVLKDIMIHVGPEAVKKYRVDMCALQRLNRELKLSLDEYTVDGHAKREDRADRIVADNQEY